MYKILSRENRPYIMGVSIIAIILYHLSLFGTRYWETPGLCNSIFDNGYVGVDFFLFLSVYGICYSYEHNTIGEYYKRRFKRLLPMWIFAYIFILALFFRDNGILNNCIIFIKHLTGYALLGSEIPIDWYVPTTIVVYLFLPLLFTILKQLTKYKYSMLLVIPFTFVIGIRESSLVCGNFAMRFGIVLMGLITYFYSNQKKILCLWYIYGLVLALMLHSDMLIYSMTTPFMIMLGDEVVEYLPLKRVICWIGKHSLEIYLAQVVGIKYFFRDYFICNQYVMYILAIVITCVLSAFLYYSHTLFWKAVDTISSKKQ